ncbi:hypothetical protein KUCAC02_003824, partial [Chaenocephalus aceratus]
SSPCMEAPTWWQKSSTDSHTALSRAGEKHFCFQVKSGVDVMSITLVLFRQTYLFS